ncbi:MAG: isoprenylcysteine carboxylmethyltransferase family protein [Pseudomonadota bacterium]
MKLKIPPPIFALICLALMVGVRQFTDIGAFEFPGQTGVAIVLIALGLIVSFLAMKEFRRAQTTVNPMAPDQASSLVQGGVFKISRNPMYLGLAFILVGATIWMGAALNVVVLVFFVIYITVFQIKPEEDVMAEKFGSEYQDYRTKVRRWI